MYTLELHDGTKIQGLLRINPVTFQLQHEDNSIYHQLSDYNLEFALLYDESDDNLLAGIFIDYTRQNFVCNCGITQFRLASLEELAAAEERKRKKERRNQKWH